MSAYEVVVEKRVLKQIKTLPKSDQRKIVEALEGLSGVPRPVGCEKLQANPTFMRIRCGDYRIIYAVRDVEKKCIVLVVRNRKDAFKGLHTLDAKLASALIGVADKLLENSAARGAA